MASKKIFQVHPMRISKQSPSTEVYNITIEGSERSFVDENSGDGETEAPSVDFETGTSFNQEIKSKNGSDSSSEVPDDVKGNFKI